jgi:hypothetical protein
MEQTGQQGDRGEITSGTTRRRPCSQSEVVRSRETRNRALGLLSRKRGPPSARESTNGRAFGASVSTRGTIWRGSAAIDWPQACQVIPGEILDQHKGAQGRPLRKWSHAKSTNRFWTEVPARTTLSVSRGAADGRCGHTNERQPRRLWHRGPQNGASPATVIRCMRRRLPG